MNLAMALLSAALLIAFGAVFAWDRRYTRDGEWHTFRGNRMRRWAAGRWEVREAAPGENDDHVHDY